MDPNARLRLATRIHFALLRHFDANVEVSSLLQGGAEAREALWVCYAADDPELRTLAAQFAFASDWDAPLAADAPPEVAPPAAPAAGPDFAPRPSDRPPGRSLASSAAAPARSAEPSPSRWPSPLDWLRRSRGRGDR